jgi:Mg2+/Co2+ transporter CorB
LVRRRGTLGDFKIESLLAEPWFVPETTSLEEQLTAFRERRSHFALVVDEYGALQGLITLGDILEEIFGRIPDEFAKSERPGVRPQRDGSYLIDGTLPIRELNRELEWSLPDDEATTIAGLVIHEARTIPDVGQRFAFHGYTFEILRRQRNQITALRVTPPVRSTPL